MEIRGIVGAGLFVAACQGGAVQDAASVCGPDPGVAAKLEAAMEHHVDGHFAQDPVAATADYTDDVWFRGEDGMELRGRESLVSLYEQLYPTMRLLSLDHRLEEVTVCGDAAHAVGHYTETVETGGQQSTTRYNYMMLWRLQPDGTWKIARGVQVVVPAQS